MVMVSTPQPENVKQELLRVQACCSEATCTASDSREALAESAGARCFLRKDERNNIQGSQHLS